MLMYVRTWHIRGLSEMPQTSVKILIKSQFYSDYNKPFGFSNTRAVLQISMFLALFLSLCHICEQSTNFVCIAALEYVGPIPYDILKPVLECCSPAQLCCLEDFNTVSLTNLSLLDCCLETI